MDTMNMKSVSVAQFTHFIKEQFEDGILTPVIGIGKSGVGKTESIFELTKELNIGFKEMRLVTLTETDMLGIPTINEYGRTDWASNNLLPDAKRDGEAGILVLDEITSASRTVRAAAYQLLDSKRSLGNYKLPDGWLVVALGNGISDGGVFEGMESAFISRGAALRIEPDLKTWKKWAVNKGVNPSIIAFLTSMPEYLHKFDPDEVASVFPCPRSWVALSTRLNAREKKNNDKPLDRDSVDIYTAASVGEELSSMFCAFYEYNKELISIEDVLDGKASTTIGRLEPQVMYLTVSNLSSELSNVVKMGKQGNGNYSKDSVTKVANAMNWLVGVGKNNSLDLAISAIMDISANVPDIIDILVHDDYFDKICPSFGDFAVENSVVLS